MKPTATEATPDSWASAAMSEVVVALQNGLSKRRSETGEPLAVLRLADVESGQLRRKNLRQILLTTSEIARYRVEPQDLLFIRVNGSRSLVGAAVTCEGVSETAYCDHFIRARVNRDLIAPRLVAAFASTNRARAHFEAGMVSTAGQHTVNQDTLGSLLLPVPPRAEQDRIVAAIEEQLSRVDAGVEALERVKKELARYRASVLKAACEGRLVPTEVALARAEGRPYEPASELLARILSERRARWDRKKKYAEPAPPDTSSLPALPEGWVWGTVEQVSVGPARNGLSIKGSDTPPGVAALKLDAMTSRGLNFAAVRYLPIAWQEVSDLKIEAGDFFVSRGNGSKALVGRASVAQRSPGNVIFPDTMIRVRPHRTAQPWLRELWASHSLRVQIEAAAKTTAGIWKISQQDIAEFVVPLPPLAEQHRIVAEVERRLSIADEVAASVDSALARAARLRQSILKRAFEGKLVPQDPNDEPASVLLARIRAERGSAEAKPRRKSARM